METTNSWTPSTLEAMLNFNPDGAFDTSIKHALGAYVGCLSEHSGSNRQDSESHSDQISPRFRVYEAYGTISWSDKDPNAKLSNNPLLNPAIALEDTEDSFTPATLEEMLTQQAGPMQEKRLRFLDLPAELRNMVYTELLTPSCGAQMDFAPCADCSHSVNAFSPIRVRMPDDPLLSSEWYAKVWKNICSYYDKISRVSRQVHNEASGVFWSQPFRFTGDVGWIMLYHFLEKIGSANVRRLKDVLVCHPALSADPGYAPLRERHNHGLDYYDPFDEHLDWFNLGECLRAPIYYTEMSESAAWRSLGGFDGPIRLLAEAESLTRFTLVLPQMQQPAEQASFHDLHLHPVHACTWPRGKGPSLQIVHLVECEESKEWWCPRFQISFEDIYGDADYVGKWLKVYEERIYLAKTKLHHKPNRAALARSYFDTVKQLGWQVSEAKYDDYCQYPVKDGQFCVNKALCQWMLSENHEDTCYKCPGNREEVLDHEGKAATLIRIKRCRRSDRRGYSRCNWPEWGDWMQWTEQSWPMDIMDDESFVIDWEWLETSEGSLTAEDVGKTEWASTEEDHD